MTVTHGEPCGTLQTSSLGLLSESQIEIMNACMLQVSRQ